MTVAAAVPGTCPECKKVVVKPAREAGRLIVKNRFLVLEPNGGTLIGCPHCPAELHVRDGKLLVFRPRNFAPSSKRMVPRRC